MSRMRFGIFMAPFHPAGINPTILLDGDLELIEHLDKLGFEEAWIGEHHSAGSEIIASPEIFIAAAAQRTRRIKLGSGVISASYHNPLWVAERAPKPEDAFQPAQKRELEIDDTELHERMRKGLSMTAGADLLLLCAWCYAYRGEHDDARFAYRQSKDREGSQRLDVAMPKLAQWVEEYRKEHPDIDQPETEEP